MTDEIKITIKIHNKPKLLAQAVVTLNELYEIKGWRIMPSNKVHPRFQEQIWIQPPCYRAGPIYKPLFWIKKPDLYEKVENKIYEEYLEAKRLTPPSSSDEVSLDDIPF